MSSPVFVDPSGRRRRVLRIVIGVAVVCVLAYLTLLAVALAGGPVNRSSLLPLPDEEPPAVVATTTAAPVTSEEAAPAATATTTEDVPVVAVEPTTTTAETTKTPGRRTEPPPGASNRPTAPGKG
ncbi:MAG: hypothetical protein HOV94_28380 [Saccharothrix sp.]|nr:hypothetical protein [Saccharothrix sp.]